jgi:hypothetical protein
LLLQYVHLRVTNFHCPVFLQQWRKVWSYSTPRVFKEFQQNFQTFKALNQQLAQKVYKCVNMFLKTGSVLRKKAVDDRQKDQLKILKRVNKKLLQKLTQETNLSFGTVQLNLKKDLHFFLYRVSVVQEIAS